MPKWQARIAPSLGEGFAGHPNDVWGTKPFYNDIDPTVFMGMYGLNDFYALWRHKGHRSILWCGSDIRHLKNGYWLDETGMIKVDPRAFVNWIQENCDSYCENDVEKDLLWSLGIKVKAVIPSFLGNVDDYPIQEIRTDKKRYYTSVSGDNFELYGWQHLEKLAKENPDIEYHCYGNTIPVPMFNNLLFGRHLEYENLIVHGRISNEEMNEQVKSMTGALRLTRFDGFSEILAKSYLWGQQPLSPYIHYPYKNREDLLKVLNNYPWNVKTN